MAEWLGNLIRLIILSPSHSQHFRRKTLYGSNNKAEMFRLSALHDKG